MNWCDYYMKLATTVALKSKDKSTQIGCVIVGPDHEIRSTGYNSFPRGINDNIDARQERPEKYFWFEHAERNAIYNAARMGTSLQGCALYIPWFPCIDCARAIVQSGIVNLHCHAPDLEDKRWGPSFTRALTLLGEAGVQVVYASAP